MLKPAEQAFAARLGKFVSLDAKGYCESPEDNLVDTVTPEMWVAAKADIEGGKGTELASKFLAAYSSSALAVNTFAPLCGTVALPNGIVVKGDIHFEQERSAWAQGFWPTLDVIVEHDHAATRVFIESKCIEFLRKGETDFSAAFPKKAADHLEPAAAAEFGHVFKDRHAFDPFDAPQLMKHFLAAKRVAIEKNCRVLLLCLWWEPTNAAAYPVFAAHADAAANLAAALPDPNVTVLPFSYPQLWAYWETVGDAPLQQHVQNLRERYAIELPPAT
jgi:hypothetical protein